MATVDVTVGGRQYQLACEDGQEAHLASVAAMVDAEAKALAKQIGVMGEARLLLMAALMVADKLKDATAAPAAQPTLFTTDDAAALEHAVARLEGLVSAHAGRL